MEKTQANTLEYQRDEHRVHLSVYHLIWCPKRRKAILAGKLKERLEQLIGEKCQEKGWDMLTLAIQPDHLAALCAGMAL
jgi:putative transposase